MSVPLPRKRVAGAPGPSPDPSRDPSWREACAGSTSPIFGVDGPARAIDHGPSRDRDASSELSACACNNRALAAADDHLDCERAAMDDASSPPDSRPPARTRLFDDRFDDRYELLQSIGAGAFGQVYLARRREDDVRVAVKKVELAGMDADACADTRNEVEILRRLSHPNVIRYHEARVERRVLHIVMEYVSGGDLAARLRDDPPETFTEDRVMFLFAQICLAVRHLHDRGVLHRDLKTANIFVAERDIVKLGDFGISKVLGSRSGFCSTVCGTPFYLSPRSSSKPYDDKSDLWRSDASCTNSAAATRVRGAISPGRRDENTKGEYLPCQPPMEPVLRRPQPTAPPRTCRSTRREGDSTLAGGTIPPDKTTGRAGLCVLAREAVEGRNGEDEGGAEFESEPSRARADPEIEGRRDPRRSEVRASERVREAREVRGGDAFARELTRESELAARREAGDARRRARARPRGASTESRRGRGEARGNAPREGGEGGGEGGEGGGRAEGKGGARRENHGGESVAENRQTRREPGIRGARRGRRRRRRARPTAERGRRR